MCVSLTIYPAFKKAVTAAEFGFNGSILTNKSINGVYKANIDCSFIREMLEK